MLERLPEYKALPMDEKWALTRRMAKVYSAHRYPERGVKLREEYDKIVSELRAKAEKEGQRKADQG